jgi:REP element-mobilizing transposase RayT
MTRPSGLVVSHPSLCSGWGTRDLVWIGCRRGHVGPECGLIWVMPKGQRRVYGAGELHFITSICYRRQPKLGEEKHRALFLQLLEQTAHKFGFEVRGAAVLPDRFHLLMTEPAKDTADHAVEMLRHRYGRRYNSSARTDEQVWETKWTDAHVVGDEALATRMRFLREAEARLDPASVLQRNMSQV